ncbi:macrophage mannose receptor 1-like [Pygocentrus nattereri]|uniref:macrophage mannose receptor 1-like n=1 Tax=Pygocentrus nattereri TaxID=42514 RepID=UPI0018915E3D|nr:macrophage mannose receptor 1-like [Pygocentrus nattereri]
MSVTNGNSCKDKLPKTVCGVSAYVPHQYHFVNESKTWTEAQSYCRQNYADLVSINNMEEMKKLNATLKDTPRSLVWIGLEKGNTRKWQWSLAEGNVPSERDAYRNWSLGEPNNSGGKEFCVAMKKTVGTWLDDDCNTLRKFMCYDEKKTNTERYRLIYTEMTWRGAQSYCRNHYTDLASVRNQTENQQIKTAAQAPQDYYLWIGLFNDSWKWSDQSTSSFRYWAPKQPNNYDGKENCTAVSVTTPGTVGGWYDVNCEVKIPFICLENKLILIKQNLTWSEALRYCRVKHVDLVSVHSEEIQLWVKEVAQNASTEHVWLGLRHTCTLSFWFWVSGESICYQNWAPGNGTGEEDCSPVERTGAVQARGGQRWVSLPETQKLNFICLTYEGEATQCFGKHQWDSAVDITAGLPATKDIVEGLSASTYASAAQPAPENTGATQSEAASSAATLDQLASEFSGQPI